MAIFNYIITCALLAEKMTIIAIAIKIKISKPLVTKLNKNKLYSNFVIKKLKIIN